jgi:two-component system nitrate/nitrite response regulator NarL
LEPQAQTRFLLVEHEEIARAGLLALLSDKGDVRVVTDPVTRQRMLRMAAHFNPDVVILDDHLPDSDTVDLVAGLRSRCHGAAVIVLGTTAPVQHVLDVVGVGASGFLLRAAPGDQLASAIDRALAGSAYVDPEVAGRIVMELSRPISAGDRPEALTPREREVLNEIARGRSNREIGHDLEVAASTVKVHVERILRKLGAANRVEATIIGLNRGLIADEALAGAYEARGAEPLTASP